MMVKLCFALLGLNGARPVTLSGFRLLCGDGDCLMGWVVMVLGSVRVSLVVVWSYQSGLSMVRGGFFC